jgi:hypothetical protein
MAEGEQGARRRAEGVWFDRSMDVERRRHLLEIARCPRMLGCLGQCPTADACKTVVRAQWEGRGRSEAERLASWQHYHQLPEPWNGHLDTAKLLFISSNPSVGGKLPKDLQTAASKAHWTTWETSDDAIVDRAENQFGERPMTEPYWARIKDRAQELFEDEVRPRCHYAITEAVRCKSLAAKGVHQALPTCTRRYLLRTIELSGARVVVGVGAHAARALPKVLPVVGGERMQEVVLGGRQMIVTFIPHPAAGRKKFFSTTHSRSQIDRLRAALR